MTREQIMAARDSVFESAMAKMPLAGPDTMSREIDMEFMMLMGMVHAMCCKQLDSIRDHNSVAANSIDLLQIASRIEKALPLTDTWANAIRAELGRLRKMAFGNGLNGKPKEAS